VADLKPRLLPFAVLAVALVGVSFGSIFARLAAAPALAIALWRMTFSAAVVVPMAAATGGSWTRTPRHALAMTAAAGGLLALHFATWITSLEYTTVASSVLLVNTAPVFVALIAWLSGRDRPTARTWAAVGLAVGGAAVIAAGDLHDAGSTVGNLLAVAGAAAMGGYLVLAREAQRSLGYLAYVAVAYGTAASCLWAAVLISGTPWSGFPQETWLVLGAMAAVSQLIGHGGYNWSLRHLQPAFVAIALTGEPVLAATLAWFLLGEPVSLLTMLGGGLVLAAILLAATRARS